jgi:GTPase KRas protein
MLAMEEDQRADKGAVPPIMIVAGNKCDLQNLRTVSSARGLEWARTAGCGFMETSAREMVNVEETFACTFCRVPTKQS